MQLRCSCGALLPEDARFCHKCGRPQYEEDIRRLNAEEEEVAAPAPVVNVPPPSQAATPIGLGNGRAIRITLAMAGVSFLVIVLFGTISPVVAQPLIFPVLFGAGFASVRLYQNRTRQSISVAGGATLGAMTWLWLFLVEAFSIGVLFFTRVGQETLKVAAANQPELAALANDPQKVVTLVGAAVLSALFIGTIAAFGGIVAARMQPRNSASH